MFVCNVDCFSLQVIKCIHCFILKGVLECYEFSFCKKKKKKEYCCMLWIKCTLASGWAGNIVA
jgi:hypothetical protein